jgi:hypothetical protein
LKQAILEAQLMRLREAEENSEKIEDIVGDRIAAKVVQEIPIERMDEAVEEVFVVSNKAQRC